MNTPTKTAMMELIDRIDEKLEAGIEIGYDDNHEGMIQLRSFRQYIYFELLAKEKTQIVDAYGIGFDDGYGINKTDSQEFSFSGGEDYFNSTYKQ